MRKLRNILALSGIVLSWLAVGVLVAPTPIESQVIVSGSTSQRRPSPRLFPTQQTAYVRTNITFNMCRQTANVCVVQLANAALPYNAVVLRAYYVIYTAFNSTTSDTLSVGTTSANANELVAAVTIAAAGLVAETVVTPGSISATGNNTAQSGQEGGFDLWVKWTAGTGNTATQGNMAVVLEYVMPNDSTCAPVPLGSTAVGC